MVLGGLIEYKNLFIENKNVILKSLKIYSENKIDFADSLLIAYHQDSSNTILHTFDKKILKIISI
jgi:predicted nucleic-acid-binding protein